MKFFLKILCGSGWVLFLVLLWYARERVFAKATDLLPGTGSQDVVARRVTAVAADLSRNPWQDSRGTLVFIGDSHIEMGNWYSMFRGRQAIRNAGVSMSRIKDVAEIAKSLATAKPAGVVVMCGINDLGSGGSVSGCMADFERLLERANLACPAGKILVLSVMPVVERPLDSKAAQLNERVKDLNLELLQKCEKHGFAFVDLTKTVAPGGSLDAALSSDGLHLNARGYQAITPVVGAAVERLANDPSH